MERDLVSIIMPSYNCGRYISESVQSVLKQTYSKWELIIVDDCSKDDTREILHSFKDKRIKLFYNKENRGAAFSRNYALKEAEGEWIAFLDSDDLWFSDKLEKQISFMKQNGYKFSCSYCEYIDEDSKPLGIRDTCPKHITKRMNYLYNWIGALTVMYHVPTVGTIQIENLSKRNDYAMWFEVFKKTNCECIPEVLAQYRVRKQSISHDKFKILVKSHYKLFRDGEHLGIIASCILTGCNLVFGLIRKMVFVKKNV